MHNGRPGGSEWLDTLVKSLSSTQYSPLREVLPGFPPEALQLATTGLSAEGALRQAFEFYADVSRVLDRSGSPLTPESTVLDFGFGWGRISRVFMHDVPLANIHGMDVDPELVEITRGLFASDQFALCDPMPPTGFGAGTFDLVYAYSVFSHLSEAACRAWMGEFSRILRPGGMVVFTTRHESFFDFCGLPSTRQSSDPYLRALGHAIQDIDEAKSRYRRGEIVHVATDGVDGGGSRNSSFYGETWIPEAYARSGMGADLDFVTANLDNTLYDQVSFALRRPLPTRSEASA